MQSTIPELIIDFAASGLPLNLSKDEVQALAMWILRQRRLRNET